MQRSSYTGVSSLRLFAKMALPCMSVKQTYVVAAVECLVLREDSNVNEGTLSEIQLGFIFRQVGVVLPLSSHCATSSRALR
jgi:hypothetical protein